MSSSTDLRGLPGRPEWADGAEFDESGCPTRSWVARGLSWWVNPRCSQPDLRQLRAAVSGKHVLITGGSFGIGRATAHLLASAGAVVFLVARSKGKLGQTVDEIRSSGGRAHAAATDLSNVQAVEDLADTVLREFGRVDIVINNAGKSIRRSVLLPRDHFFDFQQTMFVNYLGPVRLLLLLLPHLRARKTGHIVNVSTIAVRLPPAARWAAYQASKAAFDIWLRSVAHEFKPDGIRVSSIYMPLVHTRMSAPTPIFRSLPGLSPAEAANVIARALIRKNKYVAPWWLWPVEMASVIFRWPSDWTMQWLYRLTHDSESAKRDVAPSQEGG